LMVKFNAAPHFYDDYLSAAYSGLVEAASRYDTETGVPFEKYAYLRVRGAIIDQIRQDSGQSKREYRALQLMQAAHVLSDDFWHSRGCPAADSHEGLAEVLEFAAQGALIFRLNYLDCEEEITNKQDEIPCSEKQLLEREVSQHLCKLIDQLPDTERTLIYAFYFEGLSLQEIARTRLNITRSWASRLHTRALQLLKEQVSNSHEMQSLQNDED